MPNLDELNLEVIGIKKNIETGKIEVSPADETNIFGIFALGNIAHCRKESYSSAKFV